MLRKSFVCLITFFLSIVAAGVQAQSVSGAYAVYVSNQLAGEETFASEKLADGNYKTVSIIGANKLTTIIKNHQVQEFTIETVSGTQALKTIFVNGEARTVISGQPEKSVKTNATVILENGVWSQYAELIAQYESGGKSGTRNLVGFLPSQSLNMPLTMERFETKDFKAANQNIKLSNYKIVSSLSGLTINILADQSGVPLLIEIPSQSVSVVKKGFEDLLAANSPVTFEISPATNFNSEFNSEDVTFSNGENVLAGTLTVPKNDSKTFPAVIIITGSGSQDRDGSQLSNLYKLIAENLSKAGIAVLRVDDRGIGKSTINMAKAAETSYRDLISDTRAAVDYLATRKEINPAKIALLGHSEGAETALTIASENPTRISALILLSGTSIPTDRVVIEQEIYQRALKDRTDVSDETKIAPIVRTLTKLFEQARLPENASNPRLAWFREHLASNPSELAKKVKCPVLIVQGERDLLVLAYHSIALANALRTGGNQNVSLRILPNLTHIFTPISENTDKASKVSESLFPVLQNWTRANLLK